MNLNKLDAGIFSKISAFDAIYKYNAYGVTDQMFTNSLVVDIGSNVGIFSSYALDHGASHVIAFEANPNIYTQLLKSIDSDKRITAYNLAVSGQLGKCFISDEMERSTIGNVGLAIDSIPLSTIVNSYRDRFPIAYLKMDVEGAEYDIIRSASRSDIRWFKSIFIEIHDLDNRKNELADYITYLGYKQVHKQVGYFYLYYADGSTSEGVEVTNQTEFRFDRVDDIT